jgi:hypothetical protein
VKGSRNDIVDYVGILDSSATLATGLITGRVCSIDSTSGLVKTGLLTATSQPFWCWAGLDVNSSPDVERDPGMPYSGQARVTLWSYKVAGEMSTTEFVSGTYHPGAPLSAYQHAPTTASNAGLMLVANGTTDVVIGYVSPRGVQTSADGYSTLYFYPDFVPGSTIPNA